MNEYHEKKNYIRKGIRKEVWEIKIPKVKWINIFKKRRNENNTWNKQNCLGEKVRNSKDESTEKKWWIILLKANVTKKRNWLISKYLNKFKETCSAEKISAQTVSQNLEPNDQIWERPDKVHNFEFRLSR